MNEALQATNTQSMERKRLWSGGSHTNIISWRPAATAPRKQWMSAIDWLKSIAGELLIDHPVFVEWAAMVAERANEWAIESIWLKWRFISAAMSEALAGAMTSQRLLKQPAVNFSRSGYLHAVVGAAMNEIYESNERHPICFH